MGIDNSNFLTGINNSWEVYFSVSQEYSNLNKIILEILNPMGIIVLWV